jgi:hypothetical protein
MTVNVTTTLTQDEVKAFVGKNVDYYWSRWRPLIQGENWTAFNWAAFFFSGWWLAYRKMYAAALLFFAIMIPAMILPPQGAGESIEALQRALGLIVALVCGGYANRWYWSHAAETIGRIRVQAPPDKVIDAIAKRGGTSVGAALGFFAIFVALVLLN